MLQEDSYSLHIKKKYVKIDCVHAVLVGKLGGKFIINSFNGDLTVVIHDLYGIVIYE